MSASALKERLQQIQERMDQVLDQYLPASTIQPEQLHASMRYSSLGAGKRVRPFLVYATGEALGVAQEHLDVPAAAVEMIHVYSLIHDDLPAMDDDDLRRGKPTNHKAFDEATAILAGDALQARAFQILAIEKAFTIDSEKRLQIIDILAEASGSMGMVGGQAIDLAAVGGLLTEKELENMHLKKTGALIRASVLMAAHCSPSVTVEQLSALEQFAHSIGLAFQVQDDILDIESDTQTLGKTQGSDIAADKPTYPSILGLEQAKQKLQGLYDDAISALTCFDERADMLRALAKFIVSRNN
jgi:farnesyl diphosphate synthase